MVVADYNVVGLAEDLNADSFGSMAIIPYLAPFDQIAVGAAKLAQRLAEKQTDFVIAFDGTAGDAVVGVAVSDGDAVVEVVAQIAIFG